MLIRIIKSEVRESVLASVYSSIKVNKALATEDNLQLVLRIPQDKDLYVEASVFETILFGIGYKLKRTKWLGDEYYLLVSEVSTDIIAEFIRQNNSLASKINKQDLLKMLKHKQWFIKKAILKALPYIKLEDKDFAVECMKIVLNILNDGDERESIGLATKNALPSLIRANSDNFRLVYSLLRGIEHNYSIITPEEAIRYVSLNEALSSEENLLFLLDETDDVYVDVADPFPFFSAMAPSAGAVSAFRTIVSLFKADKISFTNKNNKRRLLSILKNLFTRIHIEF